MEGLDEECTALDRGEGDNREWMNGNWEWMKSSKGKVILKKFIILLGNEVSFPNLPFSEYIDLLENYLITTILSSKYHGCSQILMQLVKNL